MFCIWIYLYNIFYYHNWKIGPTFEREKNDMNKITRSITVIGNLQESGTGHSYIPIGVQGCRWVSFWDKELKKACWQINLWLGICTIFPKRPIGKELCTVPDCDKLSYIAMLHIFSMSDKKCCLLKKR